MDVLIRPDYLIRYTKEAVESDCFYIRFFSDYDFGNNTKFSRKYLDEISRRAYYRSGKKKWFYRLMWKYHIKVPQKALELDAEKSHFSYIYYKIKGTDFSVINSTSASIGELKDIDVNLQDIYINHCVPVKKKDLKYLLGIALDNEKTIEEAENPIYFNGNYTQIMFLAKYCPESTNFNKSTYCYNQYRPTDNSIVDKIIRERLYGKTVLEKLQNIKTEAPHCFIANNGEEIFCDMEKWLTFNSKEVRAIPEEVYSGMKTIKNYKRSKGKTKFKRGV